MILWLPLVKLNILLEVVYESSHQNGIVDILTHLCPGLINLVSVTTSHRGPGLEMWSHDLRKLIPQFSNDLHKGSHHNCYCITYERSKQVNSDKRL